METRKSQGLTCDSVPQAGLVFWTAGATPTATAAAAATATARAAASIRRAPANVIALRKHLRRLPRYWAPAGKKTSLSVTIWPPDAVASSVGGGFGGRHDWGGTCPLPYKVCDPVLSVPELDPYPAWNPRQSQTQTPPDSVGLYLP
ncbi:hypothetical protein K456DRAFT_29029 [Colletotrichum gloeosporioides 23]|nr:hypothetical protein K456DRAFT_29029 [Colletotrichum gloeosporioides 23]